MPARLTQEEKTLFLEQVSDATPLKARLRADLSPNPPRPTVRHRHPAYQDATHERFQLADRLEDRNELSYLHPGVSPRVLRDLRRSRWAIQSEIDLHGLTREAAREALVYFLDQSLQQGFRCVRVVTGQGWRSPGKMAILRVLTRNWLVQCPDVLAYCDAKPADGGAGALMVLLRNQRRTSCHHSAKDGT